VTAKRVVLVSCLAFCLCSCTYLKYAGVQAEYARIQNAEPGQLNVKHMIDREKKGWLRFLSEYPEFRTVSP